MRNTICTAVTKISSFETVTSISNPTISSTNVSASLTVNDKKTKVEVDSFKKSSEGVYNYVLSPTPLQGKRDTEVKHTFLVSGKASNGKTISSKVVVNFISTN